VTPKPRLADRIWAVLWGAACHGAFGAAIVAMVANLFAGMQLGLGRLAGPAALAANAALVLQFPVLHSLLLTGRGRRVLARLAPRGLGRDLAPTTYALLASVQLLAAFLLWSPSGIVWWQPQGLLLAGWTVLFAAAWGFLLKALADGGLGLQTGWIGWTAVLRGRRPDFGPLRDRGLFARCRQPIYLGFALTLWTGPVWTPDHLLVALAWCVYCLIGPRHKERRYARIYGAAFTEYRRRVPYMFPRIAR
jgi:protein-S-isoprenylcysteine O-methyltransferase Ste14